MMRRALFLGLALFVAAACKRTSPSVEAGAAAAASADAGGAHAASAPGSYPSEVKTHPLAARLCEALHGVPGRRMSECCGGAPTRLLADDCTRVLSASLADAVVEVDEAAIDACAKATSAALTGCAWVTPSEPPTPAACRGILKGRVKDGEACRSHLDCRAGMHCGDSGKCIAPEPNGAACGLGVDTLAAQTRQTDVEKLHPTCAEHCSRITHKCEPMPVVGAKCFANVGCAPGQLCVKGACAVATAGGRDRACVGGTCEDGLRCVADKCVPLATTGEACISDFDCAIGGCSAEGDGGRTCGKTCTHVGALPAIRAAAASAVKPPARSAASAH